MMVIILIIILGFLGRTFALWFNCILAKGAFRLIKRKTKGKLDSDDLKVFFQKFMENLRQKWFFKTYVSAMTFIVGTGGIIPILKLNLFVFSEREMFYLHFLIDDGLPSMVLICALAFVTFAYIAYMYFSNKKYSYEILHSTVKLINEQYKFVPTQDWFKEKSELHISNLGNMFNLNVNFKYELFEDAFASTCRDERLTRCFSEEKKLLLTAFNHAVDNFEKKLGVDLTHELKVNIDGILDGISRNNWEGSCLTKIDDSINNINNIFNNAIHNKSIKYSDYDYSNLHTALGKISTHIHNSWIQSIQNQAIIIYGKGGSGKTHLLAKIVQRRLEENLPTIFFLGRLITDTSIPIDQILSILDIKCRKDVFFRALDDYGQKKGRVLIIVDGINEGNGISLWKNHLHNFLNEFKPYKNIGIIVSVRTNGKNGWIDQFIRNENYPSYEHRGFEKNISGAVEYMFKSFSVPLPQWPVLNREFSNPLLLTLFCRAHQGDKNPPKHESGLEIIENYIAHFNNRLSFLFGYSTSINVLQDVLNKIASYMIKNGSRWRLSQKELIDILCQDQIIGDKANQFLDALVDEGLLNEYYASKNSIFYTFGYDTMGGYLIALTMVENDTIEGDLLYDATVVEALTDVLPLKRGKELFEILKDDDTGYSLMDIFLKGLPMRSELTVAGRTYMQNLYDNKQILDMFEVISIVPFKKDWPLNANVLDELLKNIKLVERDAIWTTHISSDNEIKENISTLVAWAWSASEDVIKHIDKDILLLIVRLLVWTLATTDLALRDRTTRALVNLLRNEENCLLQCIQDYYDVNDDYIVERVFAVALGCCTGNQNKDFVERIAQLTYDCVFKGGDPMENILIRDFSKSIIDYAVSLGCNLNFDEEKVVPPYTKSKKNIFVPTEEIKKYELDYDKISDKELYFAQNSIMESMRTEYSSRGLYGDFGRYTFQAALDNWDDDIEQLSNFAIKLIFEEIGYDASVFKSFDVKYSSKYRHKNTIERIGKKYQWIAMHRIAAILVDNHYGESYNKDWHSPVEINVRKFDPTLFINLDVRDYVTSLPKYKVPEYDLLCEDDNKWMRSWRKMPDIKEYIEYELNGNKWIDLYSYYTISSNSNCKEAVIDGKSEREIWTFIQAFLVDKKNRKKMCRLINSEGLSGRSSTENREKSSIYYREYYWSNFYKKEIETSGFINRNFEIGSLNTDIKVQPAYLIYTISEYSDASLNESQEVIMPSPYLYEGLGMRFSVNDGIWLVDDGSVACYDSYWVHGGHGGLFIRKDLLMDYLRRNNKVIVWPVLMERTYKPISTFWPRIQVGGYVWMDENGIFHHKFRDYEEGWIEKKKKIVRYRMNKHLNRIKLFLYNHGILKMSPSEAIWLMMEMKEEDKNAS